MKAHAMFLSVVGVLVLIVVLTEDLRGAATVRTEPINKELRERIDALEKEKAKRERSTALLRSRVTELERLMREARGGSLTMAPKADLRDVSTLRREQTSLQRTVISLETKIGRLESIDSVRSSSGVSMTTLQRQIDSLQRSVSRLESTVSRLESR